MAERASFRSIVFPPRFPEPLGDATTRRHTQIKVFFVLSSILLDVLIWLLLRNQSTIHQPALRFFFVFNVAALSLDVIVNALALRFARTTRAWRAAFAYSAVCYGATTIVWIQLTGSLSSYFFLGGIAIIIMLRLTVDYWTAAIVTVTLVVGHATILGCEMAGVLRPLSLLVSPAGGIYASPRLGFLIWSSVLTIFVFSFFAANLTINQLREKDIALAQARREAARAAQRSGQGRLTGQTLIAKYEMGQLLGRGGMGEIYRARRLSDGGDVAIKVLHPHLLADEQAVERFRREAEAASRLAVDRVPRVLDGGQTDGGEPFLVMEYLAGENLAERLHLRGRMDIGEVTHLVAEIANVLDAVHAAGIIHRDLKPQNIFLADDGRVVLLDFGISKMKTADTTLTEDADILGSPGYMAPEQARGQVDQLGPATDIFALGAIAYRVLTGRPAFAAADVVAALYQVCNSEPTPPSTVLPAVPPAVDEVLARAMAKEPAQRFARASDLARALIAAAGPNAVMMRQSGRRT